MVLCVDSKSGRKMLSFIFHGPSFVGALFACWFAISCPRLAFGTQIGIHADGPQMRVVSW